MSLAKTLVLGFIAGLTILLGLPIGRLQRPAASMRVLLNAIAVGILVFLVWDVLSAAWEPIDGALSDFHAGDGGLASAAGYGVLFAGGLTVGMLSLVAYERWMQRVTRTPNDADAGVGGAGGAGAVRTVGTTRRVSPRGRPGVSSRSSSPSGSVCTTLPKG